MRQEDGGRGGVVGERECVWGDGKTGPQDKTRTRDWKVKMGETGPAMWWEKKVVSWERGGK